MTDDHERQPSEMDRRSLMALGLAGSLLAAGPARAQSQSPTPGIGGAPSAAIPVAVLLNNGATLIDFAGPWEILSSACYEDKCPGFNVYAVAETRNEIVADDARTAGGGTMRGLPRSGLRINPDFTFADAPQPRILLIGGQGSDPNAATLDWIRRVSLKADLIASVCVGAFVLATTGLLDGREATTNRNFYDTFQKTFPKVNLIRGVRFVEDGHFATATGLTAGIDLALRITDRFYGRKIAQDLMNYEEWPGRAWLVET